MTQTKELTEVIKQLQIQLTASEKNLKEAQKQIQELRNRPQPTQITTTPSSTSLSTSTPTPIETSTTIETPPDIPSDDMGGMGGPPPPPPPPPSMKQIDPSKINIVKKKDSTDTNIPNAKPKPINPQSNVIDEIRKGVQLRKAPVVEKKNQLQNLLVNLILVQLQLK